MKRITLILLLLCTTAAITTSLSYAAAQDSPAGSVAASSQAVPTSAASADVSSSASAATPTDAAPPPATTTTPSTTPPIPDPSADAVGTATAAYKLARAGDYLGATIAAVWLLDILILGAGVRWGWSWALGGWGHKILAGLTGACTVAAAGFAIGSIDWLAVAAMLLGPFVAYQLPLSQKKKPKPAGARA